MTTPRIAIASSAEEIRRCYPVIRELRTHFEDADRFIEQVQRQQKQGFQLVFLESDGEIRAVAGYRYLESLFSGKNLYIDGRFSHAGQRPFARFRRRTNRLVDQGGARARLRNSRAGFRSATF